LYKKKQNTRCILVPSTEKEIAGSSIHTHTHTIVLVSGIAESAQTEAGGGGDTSNFVVLSCTFLKEEGK
jgi:hypothetical protein